MNNIKITGEFTTIDGEQFYKIENYDHMANFFMTITSSSDIWNFCWSKGGITAGRIDCDHSIFPYYTADKVSDAKSYTGPYTGIAAETEDGIVLWQPFNFNSKSPVQRNIYKNVSGTKVWFEEINNELELSFMYCWTSSDKYGLVRQSIVKNFGSKWQSIAILDGCRNILPACVTADFQNNNSVLLDAYKKTEIYDESQIGRAHV